MSPETNYDKDSNHTKNRIIAPEERDKIDVCEPTRYLLLTPMLLSQSVHTFPISSRITQRQYGVAPLEPWSNSESKPFRHCLSKVRFLLAPSKAYSKSCEHRIDQNKRSLASKLQQCFSTPLSFRESAKSSAVILEVRNHKE